MTEIRFYHLQKQSLDQALPMVLEKSYEANYRTLVVMESEKEVFRMSALIWAYKPHSFLPHGSQKDGQADKQPIWISNTEENINKSNVLILCQGRTSENVDKYDLVCEMLNGHSDKEISDARIRWKNYQDAGHDTTYWFQNENGGWTKKA